jgi:excisionase family DNA binding protein
MDEKHLTTREAAEYLGLSRHTLNQWRLRGRGPAFCQLGRAIRYRLGDLDAWARANRRGAEVGRG